MVEGEGEVKRQGGRGLLIGSHSQSKYCWHTSCHQVSLNKYMITLIILVQCQIAILSSFLPYLVYFSITHIIAVVGRRTGGTWATIMVVTASCPNPVQVSEVEQHDVILVVNCVSQLFLMSINLED